MPFVLGCCCIHAQQHLICLERGECDGLEQYLLNAEALLLKALTKGDVPS
jgi:hypothetical protein